MLAFRFNRESGAQKLLGGYTHRQNVNYHRLTLGDGTRFIKSDSLRSARKLDSLGTLIKNSPSCANARTYHYSHGGSKSESAGAADNKHRDTPAQRLAKVGSQKKPDRKCNKSDSNNRRHEDARDAVSNSGYRGLGCRGVLNKLNNRGYGRIFSNLRSLAAKVAGLVNRSGKNTVAHRFVNGNRLARKCRLGNRAFALQNGAVNGYGFTRTDNKDISYQNLLRRYCNFPALADNRRKLWRK